MGPTGHIQNEVVEYILQLVCQSVPRRHTALLLDPQFVKHSGNVGKAARPVLRTHDVGTAAKISKVLEELITLLKFIKNEKD